jgi:hypothetical protein
MHHRAEEQEGGRSGGMQSGGECVCCGPPSMCPSPTALARQQFNLQSTWLCVCFGDLCRHLFSSTARSQHLQPQQPSTPAAAVGVAGERSVTGWQSVHAVVQGLGNSLTNSVNSIRKNKRVCVQEHLPCLPESQ